MLTEVTGGGGASVDTAAPTVDTAAPATEVAPASTTSVPAAPQRARVAPRQVSGTDRTWWPWVALVVVLAALIAIPLLLRSDGDPPATAGGGKQKQGGAAATEPRSDAGTYADTAAAQPGEGFTTYTDPGSGYSIEYPSEWEIVPQAENTIDFTDPASGSYLRVAWTDEPGDDVMARLEDISETFAAEHADYQELQMTPTEYQGYEAGLWEYTYEDGGAALHAYNLQFVIDDEYGFALNFQTHEEDWEGSQELWETFQATFTPPA